MKILMFVYNYLSTDARVLRSALALNDEYDLKLIGLEDEYKNEQLNIKLLPVRKGRSFLRFLNFTRKTIKLGLKEDYKIYYAHDLYTAIAFLFIRRFRKKSIFIYDSHETIFPQKGIKFGLRDYFFYFFDKKAIKRADLVISAQKDRANIMKSKYKLSNVPTVINNISKLTINNVLLEKDVQNKLNYFFRKEGLKIVYAGGINPDRNIDALVELLKHTQYNLLLIGEGSIYNELKQKINYEKILNITMIGKVPYDALGQIIEKCHAGYVSYGIHDVNNKYCASNKIYEYSSVFVPILATYNPTIKEIVEEYNIGVCTNDLIEGLKKIEDNYNIYKINMQKFNEENKWEDEVFKLKTSIKSLLREG